MFCPTCGRDNARERKYCAGCGTNLEAVSQALSGNADDFFTKMDAGFDHLIGRYAERVFKDAPASANERTVGKSWKVLWQGVVTTFVDLILLSLMWNILPFRFFILLISTPLRVLSQRSKQKKLSEPAQPVLHSGVASQDRWLAGSAPVVTEQTTQHLGEHLESHKKQSDAVGS